MFVSRIFPVSCVFYYYTSSSPNQSTPFLAGVDVILDRCVKFCTRELLIHSMSNSVHGCTHQFTSFFLLLVNFAFSVWLACDWTVRIWKDINYSIGRKINPRRPQNLNLYASLNLFHQVTI